MLFKYLCISLWCHITKQLSLYKLISAKQLGPLRVKLSHICSFFFIFRIIDFLSLSSCHELQKGERTYADMRLYICISYSRDVILKQSSDWLKNSAMAILVCRKKNRQPVLAPALIYDIYKLDCFYLALLQ